MNFGPGTYSLGYLAGILSTLSPCVLPLVPIVLASALTAHRFGPLALAAGLMLSFTGVGLFIATIGVSLGLDADLFRTAAALLLVATGILLLWPAMQLRSASAIAGLGNAGNSLLTMFNIDRLRGQFVVGLVLGMVWSPCVGPTLGATIALASQGENLAQVALMMALFGLGSSTPLMLLGMLSRGAMINLRGTLFAVGRTGKQVFGVIVLGLGIVILIGIDKQLEVLMVEHAPSWLVDITTRY
jgi:cytochrome c-type biogenesis protein